MKYYLHDSNSFSDEKITLLFINFGYEGLGLFYTILEKLALQEKPVNTSVLKSQLKVGKKLEKCWKFMEEIQLISSNNGETFNEQLLNFSGKYVIKKEKNNKKISEWREKQRVTKNVTGYKDGCNHDKVNKSKVNKSKDIFNAKAYMCDLGYDERLVSEWFEVRKLKKLKNTETALRGFCEQVDRTLKDKNEILKICVEKSWGGFKSEWLNNKQNKESNQPLLEYINNYGTNNH